MFFKVKQGLIQPELKMVLNNNVNEPKQQRNRKTTAGNNDSKSILHQERWRRAGGEKNLELSWKRKMTAR